jgi:metal-responsive CopG/Arc/MetJ family transcriptional regulator
MRITVDIDPELIEKAERVFGSADRNALIERALRDLIARESAKFLARAGGTQPDLSYISWRQPNPA